MRSALFPSVLPICLLICACAGKQSSSLPPETAAPPGASPALIGDYRPALQAHPDDYLAFMRAWLGDTIPDLESSQFVRYVLSGDDRSTQAASGRLVDGNRAFCTANAGEIVLEAPTFTCAGADRKGNHRSQVLSLGGALSQQPRFLVG